MPTVCSPVCSRGHVTYTCDVTHLNESRDADDSDADSLFFCVWEGGGGHITYKSHVTHINESRDAVVMLTACFFFVFWRRWEGSCYVRESCDT